MLTPNKGSELTAHSVGFLSASAFVSCRPQLKPDVAAMTSNVKGCQPIFLGLHAFFLLGASEKTEPALCDG
jgi:hypothetical protein